MAFTGCCDKRREVTKEMTIEETKKRMERVAKLARIELSDKEQENIGVELDGIMKWIDMLQEVDVGGVKPFTDVEYADQSMVEVSDGVRDGDKVEQVLINAPEEAHGMFAVPKVVE